jgi:hypothetical protein
MSQAGTIKSDGIQFATVTVCVLDSNDNIVGDAVCQVSFTVTSNGILSGYHLDTVNGTGVIQLSSVRSSEPVILTAVSAGLISSSITVNTAGDNVPYRIELSPSKSSLIADNNDSVRITASVRDMYGNPVIGNEVPVRFTVDEFGVLTGTTQVTTDSDTGKASIILKSSYTATNITVYAYSAGLSTSILIIPSISGTPDHIGLTVDTQQLVSDGISTCTVTAKLYDKNNNLVQMNGIKLVFELATKEYGNFTDITFRDGDGNPVVETVNGTVSLRFLSGIKSGVCYLKSSNISPGVNVAAGTIGFEVNPAVAAKLLVTSQKQKIVTGREITTLTVQIVDANNNVVTNSTAGVSLAVYNGENKRFEYPLVMENGQADYVYSDTVAGIMTIKATGTGLTTGIIEINNIWNKTVGGEYLFSEFKTKLNVPAWAVDTNFSVLLTTSASFSNVDKTGVKLVETTAKDLRLVDESGIEILNPQFNKDITVIIGYSDVDNNDVEDTMGIPVDKLKMFYIDQSVIPATIQSDSRRSERSADPERCIRECELARPELLAVNSGHLVWLRNYTIDKVNKTISAKVSHFTVFVLGAYDNTENVLFQNYPNPFCPSRDGHTRIEYSLSTVAGIQLSRVSVKVYNIAGELVRKLVDDDVLSGTKTYVDWDGRNNSGDLVSDGVYFCQLITPDYKKLIKILLIK